MRIALVSPYDFSVPGGVNKHMSALAAEFQRLGHMVRILAPVSADSDDESPVEVVRMSGNVIQVIFAGAKAGISLSPMIYHRVKRLLLQEHFDVLHLHEPLAPALPLVVLRHASLVPNATRIATFHAFREKVLPASASGLFRGYLRKLDGLIAVSEPARSFHNAYFPGDYRVIPNGVDYGHFSDQGLRPVPGLDDGRQNILFVGRLDERKGFGYLLDAFKRIHAKAPQTRLVVVGAYDEDDKEPFERRAARARLPVVFVGPVSEDDLARYYRSAHVFCSPATGFESFGMVLLEAMAAGCPVVASDIPGYQSVLSHGRQGLLVEPENADALAASILQLLDDPALAARMALEGRATAANYGWDRIGRRILAFYAEIHANQTRRLQPDFVDGRRFLDVGRRLVVRHSSPPA